MEDGPGIKPTASLIKEGAMEVTARRMSTVQRRTVSPDSRHQAHIPVPVDVERGLCHSQRPTAFVEPDVIAELVHELCAPLSSVESTVQLLMESLDSLDKDEAQDMLRRVHHSTRFLQDMLVNMSGRPASADGGGLTVRPVSLGRCVERALPVVQALLDRRRQRVVLALPPRPAMVLGDEHLIRRVVVNLLTNAAKYGKNRDIIQASITTDPDWAIVEVRDHGPGVGRAEQEFIFEPYARGAAALDEEGTGLGLSIVKTLVERHGGRVGLRTEPARRGTAFWFALPRLGSRRSNAAAASMRQRRPSR
jgi:signal transduction histidine kinase